MHCGSCGAEIEYEQAFCASCGAPSPAAASVGAPSSNTVSFEFTASALPLFGWMLLVGFSFVLIVPAPFAMVSWWRWFYSHVRPSDGRAFEFKAGPGDLWIFTTVYAVVTWSGAFTGWTGEEDDALVGLVSLFQMLGSIAMIWWGMRLVAFWTDRDQPTPELQRLVPGDTRLDACFLRRLLNDHWLGLGLRALFTLACRTRGGAQRPPRVCRQRTSDPLARVCDDFVLFADRDHSLGDAVALRVVHRAIPVKPRFGVRAENSSEIALTLASYPVEADGPDQQSAGNVGCCRLQARDHGRGRLRR